MSGAVIEIWTAPEAAVPMQQHDAIEAVVDHGLVGDRYAKKVGSYSRPDEGADRQLTLIEQEQLDWLLAEHGISLTGDSARRNLVTRGVRLNNLVGKRFHIGGVQVEGLRLCQPCKPLAELLGFDFVHLMLNRSGLSCRIISGGTIRVDDQIRLD